MNRFLSFVNMTLSSKMSKLKESWKGQMLICIIHELCSTVCMLRHDVGSQHVIENFCSETRFAEVLPGN